MYLIRRLYNLRMKESNSVQAHLNKHENLSSQISSQGTTIQDELRAMILMSSLPSSWETFITTVCNASTTVVKYSEVTTAILTEAARAKDSQRKLMQCKVLRTDRTIREDVLLDSRQISEAGASPGIKRIRVHKWKDWAKTEG